MTTEEPKKRQPLTTAERQARFKERQNQNGFKRLNVWLKPEDILTGFEAGQARDKSSFGNGDDPLSWLCGYAAGLQNKMPQQLRPMFEKVTVPGKSK